MPKLNRILLVGGGSGGHILPNLAIATEFKKLDPSAQFLYVGSRNPLDAQLVRASHIPFKSIFSGKLRRYFAWRNFIDPLFVLIGFFQAFFILIRFKPKVVFSKGGYVSLPVVLAAFVLRKPVILHESDSVMGLANKLSARLARKICISFPNVLPENSKVVFTGNPVRPEILKGSSEKGYELTGFTPHKPVVLIWGGSQGAQQINELIQREFEALVRDFQIVHVTGKDKTIDLENPLYVSFEYLEDELKHIYAITDLVVGRAGANSLYELALVQKPNVLIPIQKADQIANADYFQRKGGSVMLNPDQSLAEILKALWHNEPQRQQMKIALGQLARPEAAQTIAHLILETCE